MSDVIYLGDELRAGSFLESNDKRFRLYLTDEGRLVAYLYAPNEREGRVVGNKRIELMRGQQEAGRGSRLILEQTRSPTPRGGYRVLDAQNNTIWSVSRPRLADVRGLYMQSDGNIVLYDVGGRPIWSTGTYRAARRFIRQNRAVPPESGVAAIVQGALAIGTESNFDIHNDGNEPLGVMDEQQYYTVPPGDSVPAASIAGTIKLECVKYKFNVVEPAPALRPLDDGDTHGVGGFESADALTPPETKRAPSSGRGEFRVSGEGISLRLT